MQSHVNNALNIALSANERYMPGALEAAAGVALSAKPETPLHFHLFTEQVSNDSYNFFFSTLKRLHSRSEVTRHECDEKILKGLPYWAGSRMAAVRCHYATLMPEVDWCLYLDCDILYLADVDEHFSYRDESMYACVVQEECAQTRRDECKWIKDACSVDVPDDEYFNSGVVLFNLAKMRVDGIPEKLVKFFIEHPEVPSPDQDALNATFAGKVKMLPPKYDRLQIFLTDKKLAERPVIHYVGGNPWLQKYGEVASWRFRLWHMFADKWIWQNDGESYRRLFPKQMLAIKYICYWALGLPFGLGYLFASFMCRLGFVPKPQIWREEQIAYDISRQSALQALDSKCI